MGNRGTNGTNGNDLNLPLIVPKTGPLTQPIEPITEMGEGTVLDGELVALSDRAGEAGQDFALLGRAVLGGDQLAQRALHYVAFDMLALRGRDLRAAPGRARERS